VRRKASVTVRSVGSGRCWRLGALFKEMRKREKGWGTAYYTVPYNTYDSWYKSISGNIRSLARGSVFTSYQVADTVAPGRWDGLTLCNTNIKKITLSTSSRKFGVLVVCRHSRRGVLHGGPRRIERRSEVRSGKQPVRGRAASVGVVVPAIPPEVGWLDCMPGSSLCTPTRVKYSAVCII
jgi:hypothetical protein